MLRITLIFWLTLLASAPAAHAAHGMEDAVPMGTPPADRILFPTQSGQPPMVAASVGDVNGDGVGDIAASFYASAYVVFGKRSGEAVREHVWDRGGFRIDGSDEWGGAGVAPAGDINRDGLADVAFVLSSRVVVVYGKADDARVDIDAPGDRGFVLRGVGASTSSWSNGLAAGPPVANVGDLDGDGRPDLAIGQTWSLAVVYSPGAGAVVEAGELDADQGFRLPAPDGAWDMKVASLGDAIGDGHTDVLVAWDRSDGGVHLSAVDLAAARRAPVALDRVAEERLGWELTHTGGYVQQMTSLADPPGGRTRLPVVEIDRTLWFLSSFGVGTERQLSSQDAATMSTYGPPVVDVGDQDRDGRADIGMSNEVRYVGWSSGWPFHGLWFPSPGPAWSAIAAAPGDADGDGIPEIAVSRIQHENTYDGAAANVAHFSLDIYHSRSWPHDHDQDGARAAARNAQCCWHGPWYGGPPPPGMPPPTSRLPRRGGPFDVSETPVYANGTVSLSLRAPRASVASAPGVASGWRGDGASWDLPKAEARAGNDPWVKLSYALPPPARAAIEATGRLRLVVDLDLSGPNRASASSRKVPMVVVTRPRPGAFGSQRRLRGTFGAQRLLGGPLADLITGASADDTLRGGGGADALHGGTGDDTLLGEAGGDLLDGDDGDDVLRGGDGDDQLVELRFGDDSLTGGPGDDFVSGGRGEDRLDGGPGDDVLAGGSGPDVVSCGGGEDVVFVNFSAERSRVSGCEHVYDEPGVVHVPCTDGGTDGPETLLGTEENDYCVAGGGGDDLEGRGGDDVLVGGGGNDRAFGRFGRDTLDGGEGADELEGGRGADLLRGGPGADRLNGGYDADRVAGGAGNDRILARGGGVDTITCGPGIDTVYVDSRDRLSGCERIHRSRR